MSTPTTRLPRSYNELLERATLPLPTRLVENFPSLALTDQLEALGLAETADFYSRTTSIAAWFRTPETRAAYKKHMSFFAAGAKYDERAIFGGNRTGKTHCGVFEDVLHLTGLYPEWWPGYRFDRPIDVWVATDTAKNTRDILQEKFCGKPGVPDALGTGMIPRDLFARPATIKHGTPDAFETIYVAHHTNGVYDGISTLMFKSYDQGREAFQGTRQDLIHLDEEPKNEIYSECSLRLMSTVPGEPNGKLILTETPLLGITELMQSFDPNLRPEADVLPTQSYEHVDVDEDGNEVVIEE